MTERRFRKSVIRVRMLAERLAAIPLLDESEMSNLCDQCRGAYTSLMDVYNQNWDIAKFSVEATRTSRRSVGCSVVVRELSKYKETLDETELIIRERIAFFQKMLEDPIKHYEDDLENFDRAMFAVA